MTFRSEATWPDATGGDASAAQSPRFVTVIMPIRNEAAFIERSLGAVLEQDYPKGSLEVILADGMSTDSTRDIIARLADAHPDNRVQIVDNPGQIVPTGFNRALAGARGDVIVRVDGHTIISTDYVRECVSALERSGADNVGGKMEAVGENDFAKAVSLATSSPFGVGGARFHYAADEEWVDTVYMGAWPRAVFEKIGGFDEEQVRNQDDEFNYRLKEGGGRILLSPRIKSRYYTRSSPSRLWRQYFQYGFWKVRVMQKHPGQMRPHQFVPAIFVASSLFCLALAPLHWIGGLGLLMSVGSYALANVLVSIQIASRNGWAKAPALMLVFAILHVAYGSGFLVGLFKFRRRWSDSGVSVPRLGPVDKEALDDAEAH